MAPMASPPQVRRDQPPRAAGGTIAAVIQQRQPSISSVVAAGNNTQNPSRQASSSRQQQRTSSTANNRTRSPLSKVPANNITDDESDLDGFDSSEDDDLDIFYTPNQSPRTSLASSSILFPSRARSSTPRQASRKSLRTSNGSSLVHVAPGISASNSGSASIKPSPNSGHVNNAGPSNATVGTASANTAQSPSPSMPQAQQRQQQQRLSNNVNVPVSRKPAPTATTTTTGSKAPPAAQQPTIARKAPISASAVTNPRPPSAVARDPSTTPRGAAQAALPITSSNSNSSGRAPPSRNNSLKVPHHEQSNAASAPTKGLPSKSTTKSNTSSSGAPSPNSSFTSTATAKSAGTAALGSTPSTTASTSQPSPSSSLRTNTTPTTTNTSSASTNTTPTPKRKPIPAEARPNSSSTLSLSSTTLENHSDLFSATSGSDMLTDTTPVNSSDGKGKKSAVAAAAGLNKPLAPSPLGGGGVTANGSATTARSNSLRVTRTAVPPRPTPQVVGTNKTVSKPPQLRPQPPIQPRDYSYTDDDWAKDVRLLVNLHSKLEESLNEEARAAATITAYGVAAGVLDSKGGPNANGAAVKRSGSVSSKKDEHRKSLGKGLPGDISLRGKERELGVSGSADKGKAKEKDDLSSATSSSSSKDGGKMKRKKTGATEREVLYYTATHGMPRPPPPTQPVVQVNGAANGIGSSTTRAYPSPASTGQPQQPVPVRNGYAHHMMINMAALLEEDEASDGRLSVVTERDEPETPTRPTTVTHGGADQYTPVFNAFSSNLRPTANSNAQPVDMIRRRSRSLGEQDHLANEESGVQKPPRQSSVASWADEYKEILAKTRAGQGMASGTSLLSSPSQQSFAYRSALPVPSGELPSQGTPGFTSLHLARAPPGVYVKDGDLHQRLPGPPPPGGLFNRGVGGPAPGTLGPNGRIDLTRSGFAQTTMASVEVVKGLGGSTLKRGLSGVFSLAGLGRRRTVSGGEGTDLLESRRRRVRKGSEDMFAGRGIHGQVENGDPSATRQHNLSVAAAPITGPDRVLGFTGYRRPPTYVPSTSVLVQVWAVGVDGVDAKLVGLRMGKRVIIDDDDEEQRGAGETGGQDGGNGNREERREMNGKGFGLGRSISLRSRLGSLSRRKNSLTKGGWKKDSGTADTANAQKGKGKDKQLPLPPIPQPDVGYIPGRSFVGRVLDVGWDVKDETIRKGEWVAGLLDVRKAGAMAEFIVVDRHRIHRVPYPPSSPAPDPTPVASSSATTTSATSTSSGSSSQTAKPAPTSSLSLEQMALLSLCGVPAYRAVRTFMSAFSSQYKAPAGPRTAESAVAFTQNLLSDHEPNRRRRALVLCGHDGIGAMAVQMLVLRGWRVSAHVPVPGSHDTEDAKRYMSEAEDRVRKLGGEEVVFDDGGLEGDPWWDDGRAAAVRVIDGLRDDGDVFDAVLDTMGGREIREASEKLLKSNGVGAEAVAPGGKAVLSLDGQCPVGRNERKTGIGQFTTLVGEVPERVIPTTADNFRAGLRSLKFSGSGGSVGEEKTKVGYAWISIAQDVDWEGDDVADSIGHVLRLALEHGIRPVVPRASTRDEYSPEYAWQSGVIPFEKAPDIFFNGDGPLSAGGTMVVKVAG